MKITFTMIGLKKSITILCMTSSFGIYAWGFLCHQHINRQAVFSLPDEMFGFYKQYIVFLTEKAVNPDKRRYILTNEAPKHFIDVDYYKDTSFIRQKPNWFTAKSRFSEDTLTKHGTLPWNIILLRTQLIEAFAQKDVERILKLSADVGHYLGDASVPLHSSQNYNGQFTNQVGIHALWESRIPELYIDEFSYWGIQARYVNNWNTEIWNTVLSSHALVDSVLKVERELSIQYDEDRKYQVDVRGAMNTKTYSREFTKAYHEKLNRMVEKRMRHSIQLVADFWYSCWIDAGQPNLDMQHQDLKNIEKESEDINKIVGEKHSGNIGNCEGGH